MSRQIHLAVFDEPPSVDDLVTLPEGQYFDRKSIRISPEKLAVTMIAFANADGGRIAIGISERKIEGIKTNPQQVNKLLNAAIECCLPPVRTNLSYVDVTNNIGQPDQILLLDVEASEAIHRDRSQKCYLRVGDSSRTLNPSEERILSFDKGESYYDSTVVADSTITDIDVEEVTAYAERIGATNPDRLLRARRLIVDTAKGTGLTQAGYLLFGRIPPVWSYIRILKYAGTTIETGIRSNLQEDVRIEGTLPVLIEQAKSIVDQKLGNVIRLTSSGRFERISPLPEFAWLEAVVNAVTHRSYAIQGDGIRVTIFNDRVEVESPGRLPGLVRVENIRKIRFARNPHIARVLYDMKYVRELNEGVNRMFDEMERYGLQYPLYTCTDASVKVTLTMIASDTKASIVRLSDQPDALEHSLIEKITRQDTNPIEEAQFYRTLMEMGYTQQDLAVRIKRTQPVISNRIRLLRLPEAVQELLRQGRLSPQHGVRLLSISDDPILLIELAEAAVADKWSIKRLEQEGRTYQIETATD